MNRTEFVQQLEEQVIMPEVEGTISLETVLDDINEWDSLAKIAFLAFADRELNIHVNPVQLEGCNTVLDLIKLVSEKIEE